MLVRPGTFDKVKDIDPWKCYMCDPSQCSGHLKLRPDWRVKVRDFFANDTGMEFVRESHPHLQFTDNSVAAFLRSTMSISCSSC